MVVTEFDEDTAVARDGDMWAAAFTDRWGIGVGLNGGYIASVPLRAILEVSPLPNPLSYTVHFAQRPEPGPVRVAVDTMHAGKGHAFLRAEASQGNGVVATAMAVTNSRRSVAAEVTTASMPDYPPPDECTAEIFPDRPPIHTFLDRFEHRFAMPAEIGGPPLVIGWIRLVDRSLDDVAVPLFMDAFPPPIFMRLGPGMAPTIELTVHWRGDPGPGWHLARFESRFLAAGYVEEDGELWTEEGRLVSMSRQISRFIPMS